jgi:hypothetical protein
MAAPVRLWALSASVICDGPSATTGEGVCMFGLFRRRNTSENFVTADSSPELEAEAGLIRAG